MEQKNKQFKMLSLFSGSGGFELCGTLCGIEPVAASEIEPFPIKVTKARFPNMKHLGDISAINGADLEPVDLVTGGSPCQDMSVAGKRQGMSKKCPKCDFSVVGNEDIEICPDCGTELEYTRSGLFMEQIRIIKEMRERDYELGQLRSRGANEPIRPRFMLFENVIGAFSSNKGEDFRAVLEETARIVDKTATIPRPKNGKWNTDGCIVGNGYSIAWRVLDAQYWGVPQRRRRITLVADFAGQCAGEILFKREGLSRNFTESGKTWQGITRDFTESIGETGQYSVDFGRTADRIQMNADKAVTLLGEGGGGGAKTVLYCLPKEPKCYNISPYHSNCMKSDNPNSGIYEADTSRTLDLNGGNPACNQGGIMVCEPVGFDVYNINLTGDIGKTLQSEGGGTGVNEGCVLQPIPIQNQAITNGKGGGLGIGNAGEPMYTLMAETQHGVCSPIYAFEPGIAKREGADNRFVEGCTPTIRANMGDNQVSVAYKKDIVAIEGNGARPSHKGDGYKETDVMYTLNATEQHAVAYRNSGFAEYIDSSSSTLKAQGGDLGGGSETLIAEPKTYHMEAFGQYSEDDKAGCIKNRDYKDATDLIIEPVSFYPQRKAESQCFRNDGICNTLVNGTNPGFQNAIIDTEYIVRRLTPLECSRLQGFPDTWTDNIAIENPTEEDLVFWREVFETHRNIVTGAAKPKTDKQIIKWLKEPDTDGAKYKLWGNGIALPCFLYVMEGIKEVLDRSSTDNHETNHN